MSVTAGFIVGFDTEKGSIADPMIDLIEEANIPIAMVGLLYALPNTQLTRRLAREGRLYVDHDAAPAGKGDQCTAGVNYETKRPRLDILRDYRKILDKIYDPDAFCGRLERLAAMLDCSDRRKELPEGDIRAQRRHHHIWCTICCRACRRVASASGRRSPPACRSIPIRCAASSR